MITERTLKRWRREALKPVEFGSIDQSTKIGELVAIIAKQKQAIIKMTQELLDQHLIRK